MVSGIDVSHHNGDVDWPKVARAGIAFAFAKATEGSAFVDNHFAANYAAMKDNNILRGAYHFFRPSVDAHAQAANFLRAVLNFADGDLAPALDVEVSDGQTAEVVVDGIRSWIEAISNALQCTPLIYTSASLWTANTGGSNAFNQYPLWIAHYTTKPQPTLPAGFADYLLWQYSETGNVDGVVGAADMNRYAGSAEDLARLAKR